MLKCISEGVPERIVIELIEAFDTRVRHATEPGTPRAQATADFTGDMCDTITRWRSGLCNKLSESAKSSSSAA